MAEDITNDLNYYLEIEESRRVDLGTIRAWQNLKVATAKGKLWLTGFDREQINAVEVKSIPYKTLYKVQKGKLYLLDSLLPDRNIPNLLWTPIERALPVELPSLNHNYFGVEEQMKMDIVPSENESEAIAMLTNIQSLKQYIKTAPKVRLNPLKWVVLNGEDILIVGKPILPIQGITYWRYNNFLLPTGFDFDLYSLKQNLEKRLNPNPTHWIIWNEDNNYFDIEKNKLKPLSLSSFRQTTEKIQ